MINSRADPARLSVPEANGPTVYHSTALQDVDPFPQRLVVVGAGGRPVPCADPLEHLEAGDASPSLVASANVARLKLVDGGRGAGSRRRSWSRRMGGGGRSSR